MTPFAQAARNSERHRQTTWRALWLGQAARFHGVRLARLECERYHTTTTLPLENGCAAFCSWDNETWFRHRDSCSLRMRRDASSQCPSSGMSPNAYDPSRILLMWNSDQLESFRPKVEVTANIRTPRAKSMILWRSTLLRARVSKQ